MVSGFMEVLVLRDLEQEDSGPIYEFNARNTTESHQAMKVPGTSISEGAPYHLIKEYLLHGFRTLNLI